MNKIERLHEIFQKMDPDAIMKMDPPLLENGVWSLTVESQGKYATIEWSTETGFGVTHGKGFESFGETSWGKL